jgi:hypothetical protein
MKTPQEWQNEYWKLELAKEPLPKIERWPTLIRAIQLDAMKEGMRRAAEIANRLDIPDDMLRDTILTAAEQLTEKDLV